MRTESVNVHQVLRSFLDVIILVSLTLAIETELKKILRQKEGTVIFALLGSDSELLGWFLPIT